MAQQETVERQRRREDHPHDHDCREGPLRLGTGAHGEGHRQEPEGRDGGPRAYAQRFLSSEGKHDGLYWEAGEGEPESPLGDLLAGAQASQRLRIRQLKGDKQP